MKLCVFVLAHNKSISCEQPSSIRRLIQSTRPFFQPPLGDHVVEPGGSYDAQRVPARPKDAEQTRQLHSTAPKIGPSVFFIFFLSSSLLKTNFPSTAQVYLLGGRCSSIPLRDFWTFDLGKSSMPKFSLKSEKERGCGNRCGTPRSSLCLRCLLSAFQNLCAAWIDNLCTEGSSLFFIFFFSSVKQIAVGGRRWLREALRQTSKSTRWSTTTTASTSLVACSPRRANALSGSIAFKYN